MNQRYFTHMSIPISALQRNAAQVVRQVAASGLAQEITDRGRVVAVIGPPPDLHGLERLRAEGAVRQGNAADWRAAVAALRDVAVPGLIQALEEQRDTGR